MIFVLSKKYVISYQFNGLQQLIEVVLVIVDPLKIIRVPDP